MKTFNEILNYRIIITEPSSAPQTNLTFSNSIGFGRSTKSSSDRANLNEMVVRLIVRNLKNATSSCCGHEKSLVFTPKTFFITI